MYTFLSLSLTFIVLVSLSLYVISLWCKPKQMRGVLPPGIKGWPIVGETLEFFQLAKRGNPEKFVTDRMTKYSPKAFITSLLGEKVIVLCGVSGNKFLFSSDNKIFTAWSPPTITKVFVSHENRLRESSEFQKETRHLTSIFMKPEVLQKKLVGMMDLFAKQHIEKEWAPHRQVLAYKLAKKYTFGLACRVFVSIEDPKEVARLEGLYENIATGISTMPINFPGTSFNRAIKSARALRKEFLAVIRQRKVDIFNKKSDVETSEDMLSRMLLSTYEDGKVPNDMVVVDMVVGFLIAASETTSSAITFIVKNLAELPHVYAEVLKEQMEIATKKNPEELLNWEDIQKMKYSWSVANETMRLAPPAGGTFREAITEFTYDGFTIPKGWKAYWTVHSTNKDPKYFKNPEKFDPTRFHENRPIPYSFAPFGGGTLICPGREYARVQILVFMHNLVTQFELKKLLQDEKITYTIGAVPTSGLPIRLHLRREKTN